MMRLLLISCALLLTCWDLPALAQASVPAATTSAPSSVIADVDSYGKALGALVTALAALFGLPIVFLTYRKTRAEIAKLELEASALRETQRVDPARNEDAEGNIRINIEHSPGVRVQVLADPRFLAPLLLLVDFIFAWIVLTLADRLFDIFAIEIVHSGVLAVLAVVLLLPIAKQVLRVRAVLSPPQSASELNASLSQTRVAVYVSYFLVVLTAIGFGVILLLIASPSALTQQGHILAWSSIGTGTLLLAMAPVLKPRFNRYIESICR